MKKFKVNQNKWDNEDGVTFSFNNGARLSMQSSPEHYCSCGETVEVLAWGPNDEQIDIGGSDSDPGSLGHVTMDNLPAIMARVAAWRPEEEE
jgi:hypothetical protein